MEDADGGKGTYFNYERNFWAFFDPPSPLVRILTAIGVPPLGSTNAFSDPPPPIDGGYSF